MTHSKKVLFSGASGDAVVTVVVTALKLYIIRVYKVLIYSVTTATTHISIYIENTPIPLYYVNLIPS